MPPLTQEVAAVHKLPSVVTLAAVVTLLAGCSTPSAEEPEAGPVSSPTASSTPAPSAAQSGTPAATPSPHAATSPAQTPENVSEETAEPAPEVTTSPAQGAEVPSTGSEEADAPPARTQVAVTPDPEWGVVSISVPQGSSFTIDGSGYEPGQQISINLGIDRTGTFVMDEQVVHADAAGDFSTVITLAQDLEPQTYGVLTFVSDAAMSGPGFEASKRFATIEVIAP